MMKSEKLCKALSLCLVFCFILPLLPTVPAARAADDAPSLYIVEGAGAATLGSMTQVVDYSDENYYSQDNALTLDYATVRGRPAVTLSGEDVTGGSFYGVFEEALDLSSYNELCFELRADGTAGESFAFSLAFVSGVDRYDVNGTFKTNTTYCVYVPISAFDSRGAVDHIYYTFSSASALTQLSVSGLFADALFTYSHVDRFAADRFTSDCPLEVTEGALYPDPKEGACFVEADTKSLSGTGKSVVVRVSVSGVDAGTMILSVKESGGEPYDASALSLFPGENVYTFIYDAEKGDDNYKLSFAGIVPTQGERFAIGGVSFTYYSESIADNTAPMPGAISSCAASGDGKSVSVKGTLSSSYVVNNIDGKIGVYAVDMWESEEPRLMASADMSTLFDMTFPVTDLSRPSFLYKFYVALLDDEQNGAENVTASVYPASPASLAAAETSILGVESDDATSPFLANASYTAIDVNIDSLLTDDPSRGRFHSYAGAYYYFDSSCVSSLDATLGFYVSSGLSVYVRLLFDAKGKSGVYGSLDADDETAVMRYSAAVDFLTERYPAICGIFVGRRVNSFIYNSNDKEDIFLYAKNYVRVLRITSGAARANLPTAIVALPLGDDYVYSDGATFKSEPYDEMTGVGKTSCDPMFLATLISKYMAVGGTFPWYLAYECESEPAHTAELLSRANARLVQNVGASPAGHILIWHPDHTAESEELRSLADDVAANGATLGTKTIIISLTEQEDRASAATFIKGLDFDQTGMRFTESYDASLVGDSTDSHVFIKDFRRSYGVGDFFAGGAFTTLTTEVKDTASASGERTARATAPDGAAGTGILMCTFSAPLPISAADNVGVALCVTGEEGKVYPVRVVLGNKTGRCEYTYSVASGNDVALNCRIDPEVLPEATYFAVEVDADGALTLDVSRVSLSREDGNTGVIKDALGRVEASEDNRSGAVVGIMIGVTAFSLIVFTAIGIYSEVREKKKKRL